MKKLLATAIITAMTLTLMSCAEKDNSNREDDPQLEKSYPYQAFSTYIHINAYRNLIEILADGYAENAALGMRDDMAGRNITDGPGENLEPFLKDEARYYDVIMNDMRMLRRIPKEYEWCANMLLACERDIKILHETITDVGVYYTCMDMLYSYIGDRFGSIDICQSAFVNELHDSLGVETPEVIMEKFK